MRSNIGKQVAKNLTGRLGAGENKNSTRFLYATVTSVAPWGIRTEDGRDVTSEFIQVSPFVNSPQNEVEGDLEKVSLWRGTQAGDTVAVLNTNDSQLFVLLWRTENGGGVL